MTDQIPNLDAADEDADWMKGGQGWPHGSTVAEMLTHLRLTRLPKYAQRNRIMALRDASPWWAKTIPPDLEAALRREGLID